jgi:hypothetical protein
VSSNDKIRKSLEHIFRPILFNYDIPLKSIFESAGKIAVSQLIKEKVI